MDAMFAEYAALKAEQKVRRLEFVGPDSLFYAQSTEVLVVRRLEQIKLDMQKEMNK